MDVQITLKYPKKSHRKKVTLPRASTDLSEFIGIMLGDGGINNLWQANITLNSKKDKQYSLFVVELCERLFEIIPAVRKRKNRNALVLSISSTSIVDYLVGLGLPRGNKLRNGLRIPDWVLEKPDYCRACVRGLIDTDGCMFVHKHSVKSHVYHNIGLSFTSYSPELIIQVAVILEEFGVMPHITKRGQEIYLYQADAVSKYLEVFGTSNDRIGSVYKNWRDARAV